LPGKKTLTHHLVRVKLQFHGDLVDFLPPSRHADAQDCECHDRTTLKHLIESSGVPHTEIGAVIANTRSTRLDDLVEADTVYDVYPLPDDAHPIPPTPEPRFVIDNHLGKLAVYLRIMGFDVSYNSDYTDEELAAISSHEERILLTRDRGLLKRKSVMYGSCILCDNPRDQILLVMRRYNLVGHIHPFTRCLRCNTPLEAVEKESIVEQLQPQTRQYYDRFFQCPSCRQVYWEGSHYRRMQAMVDEVTSQANSSRKD
jgi:uncharacterized protein with PIN domain